MHLLKPHIYFPKVMSKSKTIFKTSNMHIDIQEYYDPHWIEFTIWKKEIDTGMYILKKWKKIPLNKYAYKVHKLAKLDSEKIKLKAYLDKIAEKR